MIYLWERHTDAQHYSPFPTVYGSTATPTLPCMGIWVFLTDNRIIYWQDYTDAIHAGSLKELMVKSTGIAAVSQIIRERAIGRFIFSGVFNRVN